ncbi:MAG: glucokinase [Phototrophicaceae bacterium]
MPENPVLAIDIGGTKLMVGVVDLSTNTVLSSVLSPTPATQGGNAVYQQVLNLCNQLPELNRIQAIGVCFGGPVNRNKVMHSNHVVGWDNFSLEKRLQHDIANVPVRILNDANAIAWMEWLHCLKAESLQSMFYLTVSTGIGGGLIIDHKLIEGRNGMASEIGHLILEPDGALCSCGNRGCLEALAAGPAISREYAQQTGTDISSREIAQLAIAGDSVAIRSLQQSGRYVGRALATLNVLVDVDTIVIGGGVSRAGSIWWNAVETQLTSDVLPWIKPPKLSPSTFGEREGLFAGAVATQNID